MAEGRWFPVYYEDLEQNYPSVLEDPRLFWTWGKLYIIHDRAWPSTGELTLGVQRSAVDELARLGLVKLLPKHRFTVRGLDARRSAQRIAASTAARIKHGSAEGSAPRSAAGNAEGSAYQTKRNVYETKERLKTYSAPESAREILGRVAQKAAELKEAG